jgi:hypothetical protein
VIEKEMYTSTSSIFSTVIYKYILRVVKSNSQVKSFQVGEKREIIWKG